MTKIRKAVALIMILLIAVSCVPMGAFAEEAEGQEIVTEDIVPETTVGSDIEVPPEEEPMFTEEQEVPPEEEAAPEIIVSNPVDNPQEEKETGNEDEVTDDQETKIIIDEDAIPESTSEEAAENGESLEEPAPEALDPNLEPERQEETESEEAELEETEPEIAVRGEMLLAAEPTRGSAYLQMIDMDQYSYSFDSSYPEPFKNESRKRTCQFWLDGVPAYCLQFGVDSSAGMSYSTQLDRESAGHLQVRHLLRPCETGLLDPDPVRSRSG